MAELEGGEVTRMLAGLLVVQLDGAGHVAIDPGLDGVHEAHLSRTGLDGGVQRTFDEGPRIGRAVARFGKHVQRRAVRLHDGAFIAGGVEHVDCPCLAGDEALHEVVRCSKALAMLQRQPIAQRVFNPLHPHSE